MGISGSVKSSVIKYTFASGKTDIASQNFLPLFKLGFPNKCCYTKDRTNGVAFCHDLVLGNDHDHSLPVACRKAFNLF